MFYINSLMYMFNTVRSTLLTLATCVGVGVVFHLVVAGNANAGSGDYCHYVDDDYQCLHGVNIDVDNPMIRTGFFTTNDGPITPVDMDCRKRHQWGQSSLAMVACTNYRLP